MGDKPTFGVNADPSQTTGKSSQSSLETKNPSSEKSGLQAENVKPQFGTSAQPKESVQPTFGTDSTAASSHNSEKSVGEWIAGIFKMQPTSFWFKQYGFAILGFIFTMGMYASGMAMFLIGLANLVLYPFTVTILQEIGRNKENKGTLSSFFFGFSVGMIGSSFWWIVIYGLIRLLIFTLKFYFSFLIGAVGLFYIISQSKKLNV